MPFKLVKVEKEEDFSSILNSPVWSTPFTAVDLETTGSQPPEDRIIEIGAVRVEKLKIVDTFRTFVNPERGVPPFIIRLTGISESDLESQEKIEKTLPGFMNFLGGSVIAAHHAPFDFKFLESEVWRVKRHRLNNPVVCTCKLARRILAFLPSKGLDSVTRFLGITVNGRHRALGDAEATAKLLIIFQQYLMSRDIVTVRQLLEYQDSKIEDYKPSTNGNHKYAVG